MCIVSAVPRKLKTRARGSCHVLFSAYVISMSKLSNDTDAPSLVVAADRAGRKNPTSRAPQNITPAHTSMTSDIPGGIGPVHGMEQRVGHRAMKVVSDGNSCREAAVGGQNSIRRRLECMLNEYERRSETSLTR